MYYKSEVVSKYIFVFKLLLIVLFDSKLGNASFLLGRKLPCHFYDSINITDGTYHSNESISFNGLEYPPEKYVEVNYILINQTVPLKVRSYIRGCLCNIRPCVRLCCPYGSFVDKMNTGNGIKCRENEKAKHIECEVISENNQKNIVNLDQYFTYIDRICNLHSVAEGFKIHENGFISNEFGEKIYNEYCLEVSANEANEPHLKLMLCKDQPEKFKFKEAKLYLMLTSAIAMFITFMVYISLPELRNFHGKCLLFFLASLIVAFISYNWIRFSAWNYVPFYIRETFGCLLYFSTLSSCFWLNVICLELWLNFCSVMRIRRFSERIQLLFSVVYAFGLPALLLIINIYVTKSFGSIIGYYQNVKLHSSLTRAKYKKTEIFLYFVPMGITFSANIVFFILSTCKIYCAKKNLKAILSQEDSKWIRETMEKNSDNFSLYFRMFVLMGVEAIVESFKAFIPPSHVFFSYTDLIIASHGIILFILFVLRPRVFKLIRKRLDKKYRYKVI